MHKFEVLIQDFMRKVAANPLEMEAKLLQPASKDVAHFLKKLYEEEPNKEFTIRMSNIGKPLCQLQMEKAKAKPIENDWNLPLRFMFGGVIEGLAVSIMRHAGINIIEEQTKVKLPVNYGSGKMDINGTLDLVIDGRVWDIKSASSYSYKEKFASYESLKDHDDFGYLPQLFGYAKAAGIPAGGWIVIDKSSGELKVIEVSDELHDEDMAKSIDLITTNVSALMQDKSFKRCYSDKEEKFRNKPTGNRMLEMQCSFCKFRYECWPNLQHLPVQSSTAYEKPFRHYTVLV